MNGITDARPAEAAVPRQDGARLDGARLARLGLAAAMVSRLVGRLVGIVLVIVLAREAAPQTVAVYGYLLGTATLVMILTDLGVASVAGREIAAGRMPADGALHAALLPQLGSVLAAGAVTVALAVFAGPGAAPASAVALTVAYVVVGGMNNLWADVLRGTGRVLLEGALQLGSGVALVVAGSLVIAFGGSATDLLIVVLLKEVVVLMIGAGVIRPRHRPEVRTRTLLGQGMWMAVSGTAIVLLWRQGTLVIGGAGSIGALATYVVATRFFDAGVTVAHTAGFGLGPGMSALAADPPAFRRAARKYLGLVALLGVAVAVVGVLVAGPITTIPFGDRWASAVPAVRMVAVSGLPILISYVALTLLAARRQMAWLCLSAVAGALVGVAVTLLLTLARPDAFSAVLGTTVGASVMALLLLAGLRDLFLPGAHYRSGVPGGVCVTDEAKLSDYYEGFVASGQNSFAYLMRHPVSSVASLVSTARLPVRRAELPDSRDGRTIHRTLRRPGPLRLPIGLTGVSVLEIPVDPAEYSLGASKQTLRRKVRAAERSGVTCRPVTDAHERAELLAVANQAETEHRSDEYRNETPDNSDLLDYGLWLAAFAADGRPLLLSVTPADGGWAQLRYFRTLGAGPEFSDSRYLMTQVLVEALSRRGVRYLTEGTHPSELSNGLRHFQRMVGFRIARVTARRTPTDRGTAPAYRSLASDLETSTG